MSIHNQFQIPIDSKGILFCILLILCVVTLNLVFFFIDIRITGVTDAMIDTLFTLYWGQDFDWHN